MSDTPNGGSAYQNGNVQHYANAGNGDTDGPRMVSFAPASGITEDFNLNLDDIFNAELDFGNFYNNNNQGGQGGGRVQGGMMQMPFSVPNGPSGGFPGDFDPGEQEYMMSLGIMPAGQGAPPPSASPMNLNAVAPMPTGRGVPFGSTVPPGGNAPPGSGAQMGNMMNRGPGSAGAPRPQMMGYVSARVPPLQGMPGQMGAGMAGAGQDQGSGQNVAVYQPNQNGVITIAPSLKKIAMPAGANANSPTKKGAVKVKQEKIKEEKDAKGGKRKNDSKLDMDIDDGFDDDSDFSDDDDDVKKKGTKRSASGDPKNSGDPRDMTDQQRVERRERNREHAKRSRIRKRVLLDSLQAQLSGLRSVNMKLRQIVVERLPDKAQTILQSCTTEESMLLADDEQEQAGGKRRMHTVVLNNADTPLFMKAGGKAGQVGAANAASIAKSIKMPVQQAKILMEPDFRLIQALNHAQHNFVLSDPSLPDNPIVYCSDGFCKLTGYKRQFVLGRNCRFLQGPGTDQAAVDIIRQGVSEGRDISVCLLNYRADGTPFWNQFFVAALRDAEGNVVNFVGVQCEVNSIPVNEIKDRVKRLPMPDSL